MAKTSPNPPSDVQIRLALLSHLRTVHRREPDTAFIEELGLCRGNARVDLAVVNGSLHGYEIKSDRDTLRRLVRQADYYNRIFDRATLVVGQRHVVEAMTALPSWWEILVVDDAGSSLELRKYRTGRRNHAREARLLVELLWLHDALALLEARGGQKGFQSRPRREIWDRVCELYDVAEIATAVRTQLKARAVARSPQLLV
jgi:hypothetical protein